MRSRISSFEQKGWFNRTLLKKNLTRFWPLWVLYTAGLFLILGMPIINLRNNLENLSRMNGAASQTAEGFQLIYRAYMQEEYRDVIRVAMGESVALGAVFGCLMAMALFSYLMNRRSVGMLHALPIKREGLFLTNWVTGALFVLGSSLLVFFVALFAEAGKGAVGLEDLALWLLATVSGGLFFFDFALCCAMFTGHILALPVFYFILNGLVAGLYYLFGAAMEILVVGYAGGGFSALGQHLVEWFTPFYYIAAAVTEWNTVALPDGGSRIELMSGVLKGSAYAILVGAALLLIAFWVYRSRQMERAEDLVTVNWVKPIFRYGVGVCAGLAFGTGLYVYFVKGGVWSYIALVTACAIVGGFVGQMFLRKTLRVLKSGWKGSLALGMCMLLLLCGIRMDVGGFQSRVPQADRVAEVYLSGARSEPSDGAGWMSVRIYDPELLEQVTGLHRSLVSDLNKMEKADRGSWDYGEEDNSVSLRLSYTMKDGSGLERSYDVIPISRSDLEDPDSFAARLLALLEEPKMQWSNYLTWEWAEEPEALSAMGGSIRVYDRGYDEVNLRLEYDEAQTLWGAIREDVNAGRYHRYLFYPEMGSAVGECYISLDLYGTRPAEDPGKEAGESISIYIMLQPTATSTMKALEEIGYEVRLEPAEEQDGKYGNTKG